MFAAAFFFTGGDVEVDALGFEGFGLGLGEVARVGQHMGGRPQTGRNRFDVGQQFVFVAGVIGDPGCEDELGAIGIDDGLCVVGLLESTAQILAHQAAVGVGKILLRFRIGLRVGRLGFPAAFLAFVGPGYLVAVGYMDPGNWATSLAGGAQFGYALLTIALMSNIMAIILQSLCARLAIATGRDLAQACRDAYPRWVFWPLWFLLFYPALRSFACQLL